MSPTHPDTYSCIFPTSGKPTGDQKRPLSVRVESQNLHLLNGLFAKDNGRRSLVDAVQAAWALVLYTYTGLEHVCFGLDEVGGPVENGVPEHTTIEECDPAVGHLVDGNLSSQGFLQSITDGSSRIGTHQDRHFDYNTAVLFRFAAQGGKAQDSHKVVALTMPESVCLSLKTFILNLRSDMRLHSAIFVSL